jgi:hypothetical protein
MIKIIISTVVIVVKLVCYSKLYIYQLANTLVWCELKAFVV